MRPQAAYDAAPLLPPEGSLSRPVVLGSLSMWGGEQAFDWGTSRRPAAALEGTVAYEVDVYAFTTGVGGVGVL